MGRERGAAHPSLPLCYGLPFLLVNNEVLYESKVIEIYRYDSDESKKTDIDIFQIIFSETKPMNYGLAKIYDSCEVWIFHSTTRG